MVQRSTALAIKVSAAVLALAVVAGGAAVVSGLWPGGASLERVAESRGEALVGGPFSLLDHHGNRVTEADFAGRSKVMFFGYSYCPDMCPLGLATIATAYDQLSPEEQAQVVPIFVTIDPERDSVDAIADYVDLFHPALVGLTGTVEEVTAAAAAYRVYFRKAESQSTTEYLVDHSTFTYLMDGDNAYVTHFGHATTAEEMAEQISSHLASGRTGTQSAGPSRVRTGIDT